MQNKLHVAVSISLLLPIALPLMSADQNPNTAWLTLPRSQPTQSADITQHIFGCTPPFSTKHINQYCEQFLKN